MKDFIIQNPGGSSVEVGEGKAVEKPIIDQENYCGRFLLSRPFLTQYLHEVIVELLLIMGFLKPDRDFVIIVESNQFM